MKSEPRKTADPIAGGTAAVQVVVSSHGTVRTCRVVKMTGMEAGRRCGRSPSCRIVFNTSYNGVGQSALYKKVGCESAALSGRHIACRSFRTRSLRM